MRKVDVEALLRELEEARARLADLENPFRVLENGVVAFTGHGGKPVWLAPQTWRAVRKAIEEGHLTDGLLERAAAVYKPVARKGGRQ